MKRNVALLLTSLLLVFSLTACGKDRQPDDVGGSSVNDMDNNGTSAGGTAPGGTDNGTGSGSVSNGANSGITSGGADNGTASGGAGSGTMSGDDILDDAGDAARGLVRDAGDALTGRTSAGMKGFSYEQMLQNGRVF